MRGADGADITQGRWDSLVAPGLDQVIGNAASAVHRGGA
jgi:hypothetical protein